MQILGNIHWLMLILLERGNFGGDGSGNGACVGDVDAKRDDNE